MKRQDPKQIIKATEVLLAAYDGLKFESKKSQEINDEFVLMLKSVRLAIKVRGEIVGSETI